MYQGVCPVMVDERTLSKPVHQLVAVVGFKDRFERVIITGRAIPDRKQVQVVVTEHADCVWK